MSSIAARSQLALRLSFFFGASGHPSVCRCNVRFGSKADMAAHSSDVRFTPKSRHWNSAAPCPLCAKSGLMHCSKSCHRGRRRRTLIHFGLEWRPRSGPHCPSQSAATAARAPPTMDRMFMMARRPRQTATELRVIGLGYEVVSRTA